MMTGTTGEKLKQRLKDLYDDSREYSLGQISEASGMALDRIKELEAKLAEVEANINIKADWENFAKAVLTDWPTGDLDGSVLFDLSMEYGMIQEVPGGYNADHHIDAECICPEEGDPWYEYTFRGEAGPGLYSITDMTRRIEELEANINIKADFIDATVNQLAASDQRIEELEAALPAVDPRIMEFLQHVADGSAKDYTNNHKWAKELISAIRALPTPTAAELMARIQTGEKE